MVNPSAPDMCNSQSLQKFTTNATGMLKGGPCARVELTLSAKNLADMDTFSKSDPFCIVEELVAKGPAGKVQTVFAEIGRTEWLLNSLNPKWNRKICLDYHFERKQRLRFSLYDVDDPNTADLSKHDFLGRCECELADIVAAPDGAFQMAIKEAPKNARNGVLTVCAMELDEGQHECLYLVCAALSLKAGSIWDCSCLGQPHIFMEFNRLLGDGSRQMVHRTEAVRDFGTPQWRPFEITVKRLCQGDKGREFLIECYEQRQMSGNHRLLGSARTTVAALIDKDRQLQLKLHGKLCGHIQFVDVQVRQEYTFLDFISAGMQLEFAVSVDLTASNGEVTSPSSLHFVHSQYLNQYECAISAVLEICEHYNRSKQFEALGFGAQIPPEYAVSHMFPLRLNNALRTVPGVQGVLEAYKHAVHNTQLYGPTNFAPTVRAFLQKCKQMPRDGRRYQVLLILTDGIITDMQQTMQAIIEASYQPLSIIIIGIGNEDFEKMEFLDSDNQLLTYNGRTAVRDIVQFVPFREFIGSAWGTSPEQQAQLKAALAKEVLAELPDQVTSFMKAHKIVPPPHNNVRNSQTANSNYPSLRDDNATPFTAAPLVESY